MLEFLILYVNADLESSKELTKGLDLPPDVHFSFTNSGIEALSFITQNKVKLVILSEHLSHKMRGSKVCELLLSKPSTTSIPIIFLSDLDESSPNCANIVKHLHGKPDALALQREILNTYRHCQNKKQLQIEKNLTLSIVNRVNSPIFITNAHTITFANTYFLDFFALDALSDFALHYPEIKDIFLLDPDQKEFSLLEWIKELLTSSEEQKIVMRNKDEEQIHLKIRGEILEYSDEYLIITQDITSEVKHAQEIETLYNTDPLTKLPNRHKLIKDLQEYDELALAILDIDSFKVINDFYGHLIGDYLIQQVAQRIKNYISHENLVLYRLPSDSFALVNKRQIQKEYFEIIIISLIQIISKTPFVYWGPNEKIEIFANITGGIVFEKESALAHADLALREAKSSHQDYIIYHDGMRQEIAYKNNMEWVQKIKAAIAGDKIIPYFQPIINNQSKKTEKYECLVRLIDEQGEVIPPFYFLEIAKQSRLYESITKVMIKKSFQAFSTNEYEFSINLSIEDITDYNLFGYIKSMLTIYPLAERVCFEILETEKIENYQVIANFVSEVRELGCKVSIDDFGSGYSNFSHLLNLKFDYLKIDATLIKDIHLDKHKQIIVKTIVTFAKELGIKTIGEFVESKEIYDFITQMGIDYSQGYYFSAPVEMIT